MNNNWKAESLSFLGLGYGDGEIDQSDDQELVIIEMRYLS